jgi:outer membrane protein OmpA-like peptidoglycan-associated protein
MSLFLLHGCATTESVTEQTGPLDERISALNARMEAGLRQSLAAAEEAKAMAARNAGRLSDLESRLDTQTREINQVRGDLSRASQDNAEALARLREELLSQQRAGHEALAETLDKRLNDRLAETENRITTAANAQIAARVQENNDALNQRMDQLEKRLAEVARMAEEALAALGLGPRKIYGKVVHSITLTDDKTLFPINSPDLGEKDIVKLKTVAEYVRKLDVNYHIGIHGHTDGLGSDDYNYELGKARASVVKNYLHEKLGIPLLRMSVLSHGATDVSSYREGANRRIVVEVLQ